jgi:hypothetical protein
MQYVLYASIINMFFPLNSFMDWFFLRQTKRKPSDLDINFFNEMILFIASIVLYAEYYKLFGWRKEDNLFYQDDMTDL